MADELTTKPTIETVLERINALDQKVDERMSALDKKVDERISALDKKVDERIDRLEKRMEEGFDGIENEMDQLTRVTHSTRADVTALRVHFKEFRTQLKEVLPVTKAS